MFFEREGLALTVVDVARYELGNTRITHAGRDISALSFRFRGDATLISRGDRIGVGDGEVAFVPEMMKYTRISRGDELIAIHFHTEERFREIEHFVPRDPEAYAALFREICELWQDNRAGHRYRAIALIYQLLARIREEQAELIAIPLPPRLEGAMRLLSRRYTDPALSVGELAAEAFVSETYFRRLFREAIGMTPHRYLIEMRLDLARRLLESGALSVKETAARAGFSDAKYFATEFRRAIGITPSAYRRGERGIHG